MRMNELKNLFNIAKELRSTNRYPIDGISTNKYTGYVFGYKGAYIEIVQNNLFSFIYRLTVQCGIVIPKKMARKTIRNFVRDAVDMIENPKKPLELIIGGQMSGNRYEELKKEWKLCCELKGV
jgi:hypothetical protein